MIPIKKVQLIIDTYNNLEKALASGNIDKEDFVFTTRWFLMA